jgi:general L-amino acid transport system permease protein
MTAATSTPAFVRLSPVEALPPPPKQSRSFWQTLFGDLISASVTVLLGGMLVMVLPHVLTWAVIHGVWSGDGTQCQGAGACWAFVRAKFPFIVFGIYPPGQQWRATLVIAIYVALTLWTLPPAHWTRRTLILWTIGTLAVLTLMAGGVLGLPPVPTANWGGVPLTLLLTELSLGAGFPLGIALALGRQSKIITVRVLSLLTIEGIRGLPLVTILFIAAILLPIVLPEGITVDKLLRALVAFTTFAAAYLAEVLRGGLQGIAQGQSDAGRALGLSWWQVMRLIVVPQAIRKVIPPLTNTVVVIVKDTSLVLLVGLFDLLSAGRAALTDPTWPQPYAETYLFIALIYFVICFGISRYCAWLETHDSFGKSQ